MPLMFFGEVAVEGTDRHEGMPHNTVGRKVLCRFGVDEFLRAQRGYVKILDKISTMVIESGSHLKTEL